ncbi:MAG TPA: HDOD domain-containing protein [Kofleriaceae bacterium]|jgi:putative nucleotidyltransferase with HDIG domain
MSDYVSARTTSSQIAIPRTATNSSLAATPGADTTRITKALDSLPTLPVVALRIGEVVHSKNVSVQQVADILRTDPATSAKLLRLVNSPYFGIPGGVSDVARAIPFVGFNTLYQLVLSISVLDTLKGKHGAVDARALWMHSLIVATAARELATEVRFSDSGACFTAGLLHDMGKIALAKVDPDNLAAAFESMKLEGISLHEAEKKHNLAPHDRVGSRLAKQWKFPATLATPIEQHHTIHQISVRERLAPNLRTITEIVAAADFFSSACAKTFGDAAAACEDGEEDKELLERNGFTATSQTALQDKTRRELERSKVFLSLLD